MELAERNLKLMTVGDDVKLLHKELQQIGEDMGSALDIGHFIATFEAQVKSSI